MGEIKSAYRRLARRYHPDAPHGNTEKFQRIVEAYEMLKGLRHRGTEELSREQWEQFMASLLLLAKAKAKAKARKRAARFRQKQMEEQNRAYRQALLSLVGLLLLILGSWQGYRAYVHYQIEAHAAETKAYVSAVGQNRVEYRWQVDGEIWQDNEYVRNVRQSMLCGNGMPLRVGDQFSLRYSAEKPQYHRLNYERVDPKTLGRYIRMSAEALQNYWRSRGQSLTTVKAECIALLLFQAGGPEALAKVYFWEENPLENWRHNRWRWQLMRKEDELQKALRECKVNGAEELE